MTVGGVAKGGKCNPALLVALDHTVCRQCTPRIRGWGNPRAVLTSSRALDHPLGSLSTLRDSLLAIDQVPVAPEW
jgi:hypothetical protein